MRNLRKGESVKFPCGAKVTLTDVDSAREVNHMATVTLESGSGLRAKGYGDAFSRGVGVVDISFFTENIPLIIEALRRVPRASKKRSR